MKVAVLYSGGKDSNYALYLARKKYEVSCLITMNSDNENSYMFQSAGNDFIDFQADALQIRVLRFSTLGEKEKELEDLKFAFQVVKDKYGVEGIVTGAIKSVYQASRIQRICDNLGLWCFSPLWQRDEKEFMKELVSSGFKIMIVGVFAYPLDKRYLGKIFDGDLLDDFFRLEEKFKISCAGEGGEIETFVIDSPDFKKKLDVVGKSKMDSENSGIYEIRNVRLIGK